MYEYILAAMCLKLDGRLLIQGDSESYLGFFLNGAELSLNSVISVNLISH